MSSLPTISGALDELFEDNVIREMQVAVTGTALGSHPGSKQLHAWVTAAFFFSAGPSVTHLAHAAVDTFTNGVLNILVEAALAAVKL